MIGSAPMVAGRSRLVSQCVDGCPDPNLGVTMTKALSVLPNLDRGHHPEPNAVVSWRRKLLIAVAALGLTVTGCSFGPPASTATTPPAVAPVVAAWRDVGLSCGNPVVGMPDNAPQWSCQGQLGGTAVTATFIGDNAGVMELTLEVPSTTSRQTATAIFTEVLTATPAFAARRLAIVAWLDAWDGSSRTVMADFIDAHASLLQAAPWIDFSVTRIPYFSSATGSPPAS